MRRSAETPRPSESIYPQYLYILLLLYLYGCSGRSTSSPRIEYPVGVTAVNRAGTPEFIPVNREQAMGVVIDELCKNYLNSAGIQPSNPTPIPPKVDNYPTALKTCTSIMHTLVRVHFHNNLPDPNRVYIPPPKYLDRQSRQGFEGNVAHETLVANLLADLPSDSFNPDPDEKRRLFEVFTQELNRLRSQMDRWGYPDIPSQFSALSKPRGQTHFNIAGIPNHAYAKHT
ncbi:hypothetical protein HY408_01140 [Candidatus Gottesmanbacteria bacterium]|nr:hypothetical protein [Candidatus Gottesmanbacteria bacterium]